METINAFLIDDNKLGIPLALLKNIHFQLKLYAADSIYRASGWAAISSILKRAYEKLNESNSELYKNCILADISLQESSIERALRGQKGNIKSPVKYELLEFMCHVCWSKTLFTCLLDFQYQDSTICYFVSIPEYITDEIRTDSENVISNKPSFLNSTNIQFFDEEYWQKLIIKNEEEKTKSLLNYYTRIDSKYIPKAIANNYIVEPDETFMIVDSDGKIDQKSIGQVLSIASSESLALVKILSDGGVGKSTYLYWIAKHFFNTYNVLFIRQINENLLEDLSLLCKTLTEAHRKSFIILMDDVAYSDTDVDISDFIKDVSDTLSFSYNLVFVIAERENRYNSQLQKKEFEKSFGYNIQTLKYVPADSNEVFENIYSLLTKDNALLNDPTLKETTRKLFNTSPIISISERLFLLLNNLNLKKVIRYDFDWDEWEKFIKNSREFAPLENLFIAVACFYQFGIKLSVTFKSSHLPNVSRLMILKAITSFGSQNSPIVLTDDDKFLKLKHEYVASWFLKNPKHQAFVKGFFRDFLNEVNDTVSAKLLRKIRKIFKFEEFKNSCLGKEFSLELCLDIIDKYINTINLSEDEREKMGTEKGLIFNKLGKPDKAIEILEMCAARNPLNNHARDQLARIYSLSSKTYQLSLNKYIEILKNGEAYPLEQIYFLLRKCRLRNISIKDEHEINFSVETIINLAERLTDYSRNKLINELILNKEFEFAEVLLDRITTPSILTAKCYFLLAKSLKLSIENIRKKEDYFKKAKNICERLNCISNYPLFIIDYAVFLFIIRDFSESSKLISTIAGKKSNKDESIINIDYIEKVRNVTKLIFKEMPQNDLEKLKDFMVLQCKEASPLINHKQQNIDTILKGFLILQTVKYYTKTIDIDVFHNASKQIAFCYAEHAEKKWNNLSVRENRIYAENLYDQLINEKIQLSKNDYVWMLKNLLSLNEQKKSEKVLNLIHSILKKQEFQAYSVFYRFRGNAKKNLGNYRGCLEDYKIALRLCVPNNYIRNKDFTNEKAYLLNNIASVICVCYENSIPLKNYDLHTAMRYCIEVKRIKPDFSIVNETIERVKYLMGQRP